MSLINKRSSTNPHSTYALCCSLARHFYTHTECNSKQIILHRERFYHCSPFMCLIKQYWCRLKSGASDWCLMIKLNFCRTENGKRLLVTLASTSCWTYILDHIKTKKSLALILALQMHLFLSNDLFFIKTHFTVVRKSATRYLESRTTSTKQSVLYSFNYLQDYWRHISHLIQTTIIEECWYIKRA